MSTYGELIQALGTLKNVKEKRLAIKSLANMCANRAFQVRIVQRGGWRSAILPLIISLDEDCRKYAALAIANLSSCQAAHPQLQQEQALKQLAPILITEDSLEVLVYVLNTIGNFACSELMWPDMREMEVITSIVNTAKTAPTEEILMHALFCIQNLTPDPYQRKWMLQRDAYEVIWGYMKHPNYKIMQYALSILRGLSVETEAQEKFARMGLVPMLIGIYMNSTEEALKSLALDIFLHLSFVPANAVLLLQPNIVACIQAAAESDDTIHLGMNIIANLCENLDLHDKLIVSPLFQVLRDNVLNDVTVVQQHVIRAMMQLSRSPKFHHVLLASGIAANVCPIAMTERLTAAMRTNALQMLGALCATHPTTPVESDVTDLVFLTCNVTEDMNVRRAATLVLANASSDASNKDNILRTHFVEALVKVLSESTDVIMIDYMMQFFHNLSKMDPAAGAVMTRTGYASRMFTFERLESLSVTSAIYLCDTCRHLCEDAGVRTELMAGMIFSNMLDTWHNYVKDVQVAPHLALMCSAFAYHTDTHQEFVLQGGVRLVLELYETSKVEHVRLCCLLSMLYLAESEQARRSILLERGLQMLITACENETHIDLITNALKAMIPFASSDDYRPQLGMDGAIDTYASFMFSDQVQLQQLGVFLLQNLLELKANRRIFLGLASEKKCDEDYLEALTRFLPRMMDARKIDKMSKTKRTGDGPERGELGLTPHDPFIVRSTIISLELLSREYDHGAYQLFKKYQVPKLLFDLFTSEQVDKTSGEAVLLTFANLLHGQVELQDVLLKKLDLLPMLLSCKELLFKRETNCRCLSALLALARVKDFRPKVMGQLEKLMTNVSSNLNDSARDEVFFATAALQCAILSELARASVDFHERMAKAGCVEALLVFITVARSSENAKSTDICVELLLSSVFGLTALVSSPVSGEQCMQNLVFPATRFQLFMSLLRKPEQEEISACFHAGTVGLRTLQRTVDPAILTEELQVDCLDARSFIRRCDIPPAHFLYRNIVRALCLLLAHPEIGRRVLEALSPQNVVPTCLLALQGTSDLYVQVFGYLLVGKFSSEPSLLHGFVCSVPVVTELLTCCRRYMETGDEELVGVRRTPGSRRPSDGGGDWGRNSSKEKMSLADKHGSGPWSPKAVARNRFLLAMVALTHLAENAKEKYKPVPALRSEKDDGHAKVIRQLNLDDEPNLTEDDQEFLRKFAAVSFRDLDCDTMLYPISLGAVNEFTGLLRLVIVNNNFIRRIILEQGVKGGEVPVERIDAKAPQRSKISLKSNAEVPLDLRPEFKNLGLVQRKTDGLLQAVGACLEANVCLQLVIAIVECLGGISYFSPLCIAKPHDLYRLVKRSPEWLMPSLSCLFANIMAHKARIKQDDDSDEEKDPMVEEESDCLFPLISKSLLETREHLIAALSNMTIQTDKFGFVQRSGVFKLYTPIRSRGYFLEHFAWMLQLCRLLTNTFCYIESHKEDLLPFVTQSLVSFLKDVLHITADLLCSGELSAKGAPDPEYNTYRVTFGEDDVPPLGLKIWWALPPRISEVLPDTPATHSRADFKSGDELLEVNGVDVSQMEKEQILPMFDDRPLYLTFRRLVELKNPMPNGPAGGHTQVTVEEVEKLECYGDRLQYIECFNLVLLTIHNLATQGESVQFLLREPQIMIDLLEVLPHDVLSPTLRRLVFSTVSCLARDKDVSGQIFGAMRQYFEGCDKADPSLHKYVLLCSNLFYTSMKSDEVEPDEKLLSFVGHIAALESAASSNMALVEILHGMSLAGKEDVADFTTRETMVSAVDFMEITSQWDCQARAFETVFFLTQKACDPELWASIHLMPRMIKAASHLTQWSLEHPEVRCRADAVWDLTLRTAQVCLAHPEIVEQLQLQELDRGLLETFSDPLKPITLAKLAADLMAGLFQTPIAHVCWYQWRTMGFGDKLLGWFGRQRKKLQNEDGGSERQAVFEVSVGDCLDAAFHMLTFAVEAEPGLVGTLSARDVTQCLAVQILSHAAVYARHFASKHQTTETAEAVLAKTNVAFRLIAQLMTALLASEKGLAAMTGMNLEEPLVKLLELPPCDCQASALLMLCALSGKKESSEVLLRNATFMKMLNLLEDDLRENESNMRPHEFEYYTSLVDRTCCHPELTREVLHKLFVLVCRLPVRALTANSRLMAVRTLAQCGLEEPSCLNGLPENGLTCLHYLLAATSSLWVDRDKEDPTTKPRRKSIAKDVAAMTKDYSHEARLASHYARATLCEAVSVSREVCKFTFPELDCASLISATTTAFGRLIDNMDGKLGLDLVASEALNHVVAMLHVMLCVVFRQGHPGEPYKDPEAKTAGYVTASMVSALEALYGCLQLHRKPADGNPSGETTVYVAQRLTGDLRVQFWLSALLREICAKPLRSSFLRVVRTKIFHDVLASSILLALKRLEFEVHGPVPKDLFAKRQVKGMRDSPLAERFQDLSLSLVFEHLIVCLRHMATQAMYAEASGSDDASEPWRWRAQERLEIHHQALNWLPEVVKRYSTVASIKTEAIRYICAISSFYEAPGAKSEYVPGSAYELLRTFSLFEPKLLELLTVELEVTTEACTQSLACLAVANLAQNEWQRRKLASVQVGRTPAKMPVDELGRMVRAVVRVLQCVPDYPRENEPPGSQVGVVCTMNVFRALSSILAFNEVKLTVELMATGVLEAVQSIFDHYFRDLFSIKSPDDFATTFRQVVLLLRNWAVAGCTADQAMERRGKRDYMRMTPAEVQKAEQERAGLAAGTDAPALMNFLVRVVQKVADEGLRPLHDLEKFRDDVYVDFLLTLQTLLQRTSERGSIQWDDLNQVKFENLLETIKEHRRQRSGNYEDEMIMKVVYLLTSQGFPYIGTVFPRYMMEIAYGPREAHTPMQDVAAVCCAIQSTRAGKGKATRGPSAASVIKDYVEFIRGIDRLQIPRMQVWHYRLLSGECQREAVLAEIAEHAPSLKFVVDRVCDDILGRYSVAIVHNLSVHRPMALVSAGHLGKMCEAYRAFGPGGLSKDERERRMLRRLCIASLRNSLFGTPDLDRSLGDSDLAAVVGLVAVLEKPDTQLYLASLLTLIRRCFDRAINELAKQSLVVELVTRCLLEKTTACMPSSFHAAENAAGSDLYVMQVEEDIRANEKEDEEIAAEEEEAARRAEEQAREAAAPVSPTATQRPLTSTRRPPEPGTSPVRGLGKRVSLWQTKSRARTDKALGAPTTPSASSAPARSTSKGSKDRPVKPRGNNQRRGNEHEFVYFASEEILTSITFIQASDAKDGPVFEAVREAVDAALRKHTISAWLKELKEQVALHEKRRIRLTDLFMQCSAKFVWHCWVNPVFKAHMNTPENLEVLATIAPHFFSWELPGVKKLYSEVALYAGLHRYHTVTDYLVEHHSAYPELSANLLGHALSEQTTKLRMRQANSFIGAYVEILKERSLSRQGLRRLVVSLEHALLSDHPGGLCAELSRKEIELLTKIVVALRAYSETPIVKHCLAVLLAQTMGPHYAPVEELDAFVLLVLDMSGPLLEKEFAIFMPVLHGMVVKGGRRIAMPLIQRQLHMRVARLLEEAVEGLEDPDSVSEPIEPKVPTIDEHQEVQWNLALLTLLAGCNETEPPTGGNVGEIVQAHDPHFEAFVCVDLLPVLVRVLRASPHAYETLAAGFLISSVAHSACMPPYMPDIVRLAETSILPRLTFQGGGGTSQKFQRRRTSIAQAQAKWQPVVLPIGERMLLGINRSFIHLVACAGYQPHDRPALLNSELVFKFLSGLECDADMFADPSGPLHVKLHCFAHLCARKENHPRLLELGILESMRKMQIQIAEAAEMLEEFAEEPHDLRLHWLHCLVSLLAHAPTGARILADGANVDLVTSALSYSEVIALERRPLKRRKGLNLVYEGQAALAAALVKLSPREDFAPVHSHFTLFVLGLICSGPLENLRVAACECTVELLTKGARPEVPGVVLMKTPGAESFKRTICGPNDDLASGCAQVMVAFMQRCGYNTHVHLMQNAEAVMAMIADAGSNALRCMSLAELFFVMSLRTEEVLNVLVDVPDLTPFLRLARSSSACRRDVVQQWLELFGTSMYEIDETVRIFKGATMDGFLHLAATCTLDPEKAEDLRRCMFSVIRDRLHNWRHSPFGITQFASEALFKAIIPMCQLQADLVAGVVAMFHSFITHNERVVLNRLWTEGHFAWLCQRMTHQSVKQVSFMEANPRKAPIPPTVRPWERHEDLVATQGMVQRLVWILYHMNESEAAPKVVDGGWIIRNWQKHILYYCHYVWPMRHQKEIDEATDSILILAMKFVEELTFDSTPEMQLKLINQGVLRLCSTVLLPNPDDQRAMLAAVHEEGPSRASAQSHPPEVLALPKQKMIAGSITVRLMQLRETYEFYKEPQAVDLTVGMLAQLHNWRAAMFDQQGSVSVLHTVGLLERSAALYSSLVSGLTIEWHLDRLGLRNLEVLSSLLLDVWCRHPNAVLKHHALRLVSLFCQVQVLFMSIMAFEPKAVMLSEAVHRILGIWDVRELRHAMRLMVAGLSHALGIAAMPERIRDIVAQGMKLPEAASLREILQKGGPLRANQLSNRHLLLPKYITSMTEWCEHPGDLFGRTWAQWLIVTLLAHGDYSGPKTARGQDGNRPATAQGEQGVVVFGKDVEEGHILRRARLEAEQQSVALHEGKEAPLVSAILPKEGSKGGPSCVTEWISGSARLGHVVSRMVGKCIKDSWKPARLVSCVNAARCLVEHPHFLCNAAETIDGTILVRFLTEDDRPISLASLMLISMLASYRLPLKAQNCASSFLTYFYELQETVIEGFSKCGDGPYAYDSVVGWMHTLPHDQPLQEDFRCLVIFMLGQCLLPPLALAPSLDMGEALPGGPDGPPAVAQCEKPPKGLMDKIAQDVLAEDQRLKDAQVKGTGPMFSTMLCNLLYALCVYVPFHPKAAADSQHVRGAAFSQLFKIQQIVSLQLSPKNLFEPEDKDRSKLFLYIRAIACIRLALRVITGSWFAPDIGVRFVISEQGGRDFMQYCTRHLIQVYNGKTSVTRVLGTPWERMMLSQGPTDTIAELLLMVCSSDQNLVELEFLGGERALHALSQYAEDISVRQQATMLLSKLAVMTKT